MVQLSKSLVVISLVPQVLKEGNNPCSLPTFPDGVLGHDGANKANVLDSVRYSPKTC